MTNNNQLKGNTMNFDLNNYGRSYMTVTEIVSTMIKNGEQESDSTKYTNNFEEWCQVISLFQKINGVCKLQAEVELLQK
jgi:hypothetical protein